MVLTGAFAGLALVVAPQLQNSVIKPYFWILIAVGLFDGGNYLLGRTAAGQNGRASYRLRDRGCGDGGDPDHHRDAGQILLEL